MNLYSDDDGMLSVRKAIKLPQMPNFILLEDGSDETKIAIESLDREEMERYANWYRDQLLKHWERKKPGYRYS